MADFDDLLTLAYEMTDRPPLAKAMAAPPAGARGMWSAIVPECPFCQATHLHRAVVEADLFAGGAVRKCSVTDKDYTLFVTQRTQAARRA